MRAHSLTKRVCIYVFVSAQSFSHEPTQHFVYVVPGRNEKKTKKGEREMERLKVNRRKRKDRWKEQDIHTVCL